MLPYYLSQLSFINQANIHDHLTKTQNKLQHEHARHCVRHQIPEVMNSAPIQIVTQCTTHSLPGFTIYIKHIIIQSYQEICNIYNFDICSQLKKISHSFK